MSLIIGLLVTAFILFFFEIFVPGGVLAAVGGILLLTASGLAYTEWGFLAAVAILLGGLAGALSMFFVEIKMLSSSRLGRQLALQSAITARLNPRADDSLVGKEGVTLTTLAPTGKVQVLGQVHTAFAQDGYLEKGAPIKVVRIETFKLIVAKK